MNIVTVSANGVPIKTLEFQGNTHLLGPGYSFSVTASPMVVSAESGVNGDIYPTINTNGTLEKMGPGTVTLLGPNSASPLKVSAGTIVIGEQGVNKGSLSGSVDLAGGTLKFNRSDSVTFGLAISGTGTLEQAGGGAGVAGSGTLFLSNTGSTHTGPVNVTGGTLFMDGSLATSTNAVTVSAYTTLGGRNGNLSPSYRVNRPVTLQAHATLAPGHLSSVGTLNLGGDDITHTLTTSSDAILVFELAQPGVQGGASNDFVDVKGNINFDANTVVAIQGTPGVGTYPLFKYTGSVSSTLPTRFSGVPAGMLAVVTVDTTSKLVNLQLIPSNLRWAPNASNADCAAGTNLGGGGGTSNWDTGTPWCNANNTKQAWVDGATAQFLGTGGTATIATSSPKFNSLDFQVDGMTITGGTLTGTMGTETVLAAGSGITATISSVLAGSLPYRKTGDGVVVLTGTNTLDKTLAIDAGKLSVGSGGAVGRIDAVTGVTVSPNAALRFNLDATANNPLFAGSISGGGGLEKAGLAHLELTGSLDYTGATKVEAGSLYVHTTSFNSTSGVEVSPGASVNMALSDNASFNRPISGAGVFSKSNHATTLKLGGDNTSFTGNVHISNGTLLVTHANALGNSTTGRTVVIGGTLDINGFSQPNEFIVLRSGTTLKSSTGNASLGQTLELPATPAAPSTSFSLIDVDLGATLTLAAVKGAADTTSVSKVGAGTLVLSGTNSEFADTNVNVYAGTLLVNGALPTSNSAVSMAAGTTLGGSGTINRRVTLNGASPKLEPGNASGTVGTLKTGAFTVGSSVTTAQLNFQLGSSGNDLVEVTGDLKFDGTANLNITQNGTLEPGTYPLFKYSGNATGLSNFTVGTGVPATFTAKIELDETDSLNKRVVLKIFPPSLVWAPGSANCSTPSTLGGAGTWNSTNVNWCNGTTKVQWQQGATAVFPNTTGGTVQVDSTAVPIEFEALTFERDGYILSAVSTSKLTATTKASTQTAITTNHATGNTAINLPLEGTLPFGKNGTGTLQLSGSNLISGIMAVNGGTLRLTGSNPLGGSPEVQLAGGNLALSLNHNVTFGNKISGTGTVTKEGSSLTLTLSGNNTYAGLTNVTGTLIVNHANALGAAGAGNGTIVDGSTSVLNLQADAVAEPITLQNGSKLLSATADRSLSGSLSVGSGGGTVEVSGTTALQLSGSMGSGSGTLTKAGTGRLVLSQDNGSHTGSIVVSAGRLVATHNNALGAASNGTTVQSAAALELQGVSVPEPVTLNAGSLIGSGTSSTVGGTVTLAASSINNVIDVAGELIFSSTFTTGATDATSAPTWEKIGTGRLELRGSVSQWLGTTTLTNGTLLANGGGWPGTNPGSNLIVKSGAVIGGKGNVGQAITLQNGAKLEPGDSGAVGTLTLNHNLSAQPGSVMTFQLGEPEKEGGLYNDFVTITNGQPTGGTVNILETPGRTLAPGTYPLIKYVTPTSGAPQLGTLPSSNMRGMVINETTKSRISLVLTTSANLRWAPNATDAQCAAGTNLGGTGTWDSTTPNWCPEGGTARVPWVPGATAVFPASGGVVTVNGTQIIEGVTFQVSGVELKGGTSPVFTNTSGSATVLHSDAGVSNVRITFPLTGALAYTKKGDGDVALVSTHTFTGALKVEKGRLLLGDGTTSGTVDNAGSIQVDDGAFLGFNPASNISFSKVVSGAGGLEKLGSNTLTLTGTSTYTGPTKVTAGTLQIGGQNTSGAIAGPSDVNLVSASSTLVFNRTDAATSPITFDNVISGLGKVSKPSTSSSIVILTGNNSYSGTTTVTAGTLAITHANALGIGDTDASKTIVANGAILDVRGVSVVNEIVDLSGTLQASTGSGGWGGSVTLTGSATVDVATQFTLSGIVGGSSNWTKAGAGTLILSGNNTYSAQTTVSAGTLAVAHANGLGSASNNTATSTTVNNSATLDIRGVSVGNERVVLNNTAKLMTSTGSASLSGDVAVSGTANEVDVGEGGQLTLSGAISNSNPITKKGLGRLVISGTSNTHTGAVSVSAGTLLVNGSLASSTTNAVTVDSGATLGGTGDVNRKVTLKNGAKLEAGSVDAGGNSTASTLTTKDLTVNDGAEMNFQLGASPADYVDVKGVLTFDTSTNTKLNVTSSGVLADGIYPLFKYTGTAPTLTNVNVTPNIGTLETRSNEVVLVVGSPTLYWTPSGNCAGTRGGDGEWNSTDQFWCSDATGGTLRAWYDGATAVFTGAASTVTVPAGRSFKDLVFQTANNVSISGSTLTSAGATALLKNDGTGLATIGSELAGAAYNKEGTGPVTLSGSNTFTGAMVVNGGKLTASSTAALGTIAGSSTVTDAATLELTEVGGPEPLVLNGGTLLLNFTVAKTLNGAMTLAAGKDSAITVVGTSNAVISGKISGSGNLIKRGSSGLYITNSTNDFTGNVVVDHGALVLGNNANGGRLSQANSFTLNKDAGGGTLGVLRFNWGGNDVEWTQAVNGTGDVEKLGTGTVILKGSLAHSGTTKVSVGTLQVGDGTAVGTLSSTSGVSVSSGAYLHFKRSDPITFNQPISGLGNLDKSGTGSLTLTGSHSIGGTVTVSEGALLVDGTLSAGAAQVNVTGSGVLGGSGTIAGKVDLSGASSTLEPGSASVVGTLKTGQFKTTASTVVLNFQLGQAGTAGGPQNDLVEVTGNVAFDNGTTVNVTVAGNGNLPEGSYTLFTHTGSRTGTLTKGSVLVAADKMATIVYDANAVRLVVGGLEPVVQVATKSTGGVGTFHYTMTGLSANQTGITTSVEGVAVGSGPLTGTPDQAVTITQTGVPVNWPAAPAAASCEDTSAASSGNAGGTFASLSGSVLTLPASYLRNGATIVCTFENLLRGLSGKVFNDGGAPVAQANTGVPNDGVRNGAEAGLGGMTVQLSNCGGGVLASTVTDSSGAWSMNIPMAQVGTEVCVAPALPTDHTATGASVSGVTLPDNTATPQGMVTYTYSRASHRVRFTAPASGAIVLDFGQVPPSTLSASGSRAGSPAGVVLHAHQFTAGTAGQVAFSAGGAPSSDGWQEAVYLDANCSATLEPDEVAIYPAAVPVPQAVTQGQTVCLLMRQWIPGNASNGQSRTVPVVAELSFANASPALSASYTVNDVTTVGASQLHILKSVRVVGTQDWSTNNKAKPGEELEYRITIRNNGPAPIRQVKVTDFTPEYTTFVSASVGALPAALGTCTKTTPGNTAKACDMADETQGGTGAAQWAFDGDLNAGPKVELYYIVKVK